MEDPSLFHTPRILPNQINLNRPIGRLCLIYSHKGNLVCTEIKHNIFRTLQSMDHNSFPKNPDLSEHQVLPDYDLRKLHQLQDGKKGNNHFDFQH